MKIELNSTPYASLDALFQTHPELESFGEQIETRSNPFFITCDKADGNTIQFLPTMTSGARDGLRVVMERLMTTSETLSFVKYNTDPEKQYAFFIDQVLEHTDRVKRSPIPEEFIRIISEQEFLPTQMGQWLILNLAEDYYGVGLRGVVLTTDQPGVTSVMAVMTKTSETPDLVMNELEGIFGAL